VVDAFLSDERIVTLDITGLPIGTKRITIQRQIGDGSFEPLRSFRSARRKVNLDDTPDTDGIVRYRVRIERDRLISSWGLSDVVELEGDPGVDPPPVSIVPPPSQNRDAPCPASITSEIIAQTNQLRVQAGVGAVQLNENLAAASQMHSKRMARGQEMTHDGWFDEIMASHYTGHGMSQNIAFGYPSGAAVVTGWYGSAEHRMNMLAPNWQDIGIGCVVDPKGLIWWTENFGAP